MSNHGSDFFLVKVPKDSLKVLYDATSGKFHLVRLSSVLGHPGCGKDIEGMKLPLSLRSIVKIKVEWDPKIEGNFWEGGGVWRRVKLPLWLWRRRLLGGSKIVYVVRKGAQPVVGRGAEAQKDD